MKVALFFALLFLLMLGQVWGTRLQVRSFKRAMAGLHKRGNVGVGSKKRKAGPGYVVLISCDGKGVITGGGLMKGITVFNRFKPFDDWNGQVVYDVNRRLKAYTDAKREAYSGYIQALDALERRLTQAESGEEKTN